jgi:hypothetical protein
MFVFIYVHGMLGGIDVRFDIPSQKGYKFITPRNRDVWSTAGQGVVFGGRYNLTALYEQDCRLRQQIIILTSSLTDPAMLF